MTDTAPADLDRFWERTLARTRSEPLNAQIEPVKEILPYHKFRLTYKSLEGVPIRAYLSLPWDAISTRKKSKRWPVIVTCPGYSGWGQVTQLSECQLGYAVLQMYPRGMGESAELWRVPDHCVSAWINYGRENPEGFYYQGAYMDMVRAIDYLVTRPDIDPGRIGLSSGSGGGLIVLAVGSLDPRVRAVVAEEPFLCDFLHNPAQANFPGNQRPGVPAHVELLRADEPRPPAESADAFDRGRQGHDLSAGDNPRDIRPTRRHQGAPSRSR